jgi:hypothetical protein
MIGNSMADIIEDGSTSPSTEAAPKSSTAKSTPSNDGMLRIKYLHECPATACACAATTAIEHPDEYLTMSNGSKKNFLIVGWVFWWSTLNNRRPVPLDEHLLGWEGSNPIPRWAFEGMCVSSAAHLARGSFALSTLSGDAEKHRQMPRLFSRTQCG